MTTFAALAPLLQAVAAAPDTLLVRPLPPVRSGFEQVIFVASGMTSILTLVLVAVLLTALLAVRRSVRRAHDELDRRLADFGRRVDDFNHLLGRVHTQAERAVDLASGAMSTVEWGADKLKQFKTPRRRRRKEPRPTEAAPDATLPESGNPAS